MNVPLAVGGGSASRDYVCGSGTMGDPRGEVSGFAVHEFPTRLLRDLDYAFPPLTLSSCEGWRLFELKNGAATAARLRSAGRSPSARARTCHSILRRSSWRPRVHRTDVSRILRRPRLSSRSDSVRAARMFSCMGSGSRRLAAVPGRILCRFKTGPRTAEHVGVKVPGSPPSKPKSLSPNSSAQIAAIKDLIRDPGIFTMLSQHSVCQATSV